MPTVGSLNGAKKVIEEVEACGEDDLVVCMISGGGSALMCYPCDGISLEDVQVMNDWMLKRGLSIDEINCVRKHVSRVKGGRLAEAVVNRGMVVWLLVLVALG